jgi:hypothetical protein
MQMHDSGRETAADLAHRRDVDVEQQPEHADGAEHASSAPTRKHAAHEHHPGGRDALGQKEDLLAPFFADMQEVASALVPRFEPLGLHFRPEILLATAMQEASSKDPLNTRSFDNGLGIMQITPYHGKLGGEIAKAIGWDNSRDVEWNVKHSRWREAKANLFAGAYMLLGKAYAIKEGVRHIWEEMNEAHRWRAVLFAYNAGQGAAIRTLKEGGPNAPMISSFTYRGQRVSHDYTAEIQEKLEYVDEHDPFGAQPGGHDQPGKQPATTGHDKPPPQQKPPHGAPGTHHKLRGSVGQGGVNTRSETVLVQVRLQELGIDVGPVDGIVGVLTVKAILIFQEKYLLHPDGLIRPGHVTERHLFGGGDGGGAQDDAGHGPH